jgi:glutamate-1-semialdehyde 2,1-aminomutase
MTTLWQGFLPNFLSNPMSERYKHSESYLERAMRVIPLGSQTFSKSITALPFGISPYFVDRASGSHFWDIDGNKFLDFVNGLACVTLGYRDPDVDTAVLSQMQNGVTFSLPHRLETLVAEQLVDLIPCAEMVRFAKNGSDVTSAAVRIARACTGRERVAVCGYHGWQDWYIGSTSRNLGVPMGVQALTHSFAYNDLNSLRSLFKAHPGEFAAVILEPMNATWPSPGFLEGLREMTRVEGSLLVFDETITGFRFDNGGAQAYFGVRPDLATFGKGIANGYPLSAVVGRRDYMGVVEDIFFSGTFGGETLSLAAAQAVLSKYKREPVIEKLRAHGEMIMAGVSELISVHELTSVISVSGHPAWSFLQFFDSSPYTNLEVKSLFLQEVFRRGVYTLGTHNMSYAHSDEDVAALLMCYDDVFGTIANVIRNNILHKILECSPLTPLFKVR